MVLEDVAFDARAVFGVAALALAALIMFWLYHNREKAKLVLANNELRKQITILQTEEAEFREKDYRPLVAEKEKLKTKVGELEDDAIELKKGGKRA